MIQVYANLHRLNCTCIDAITTGSVGFPVRFDFSDDWEGLGKVAVFRGSGQSVDVYLDGDSCSVPPEVLTEAGNILSVGVYGTDGEEVVIPTIYKDVGLIFPGAELSGQESEAWTPALVDQMLSAAEAAQVAAEDAADLAESIREDADDGVFDGVDGVSPTVTVTEITGGHRVAITDVNGTRSFDVMDGQSGNGVTIDDTLSQQGQAADAKAAGDAIAAKYSKPSGGIPSSDMSTTVQTLLGKANTALQQHQSLSGYATEQWVGQQGYLTQHQSLAAYRTSAAQDVIDAGKEDKVTEVTISTAGAVTQALDAGKIYHFTGALTSLTITLNAAGTGIIPQYHFDFDSGSTAPTVTLPGTVTMQGGTFTPEASKHYEVDILNGYGVSMAW